MSEKEKPTTAFILSLIGGIFILLGGGMVAMIGSFWSGGRYGGYQGFGMMGYGYGGYGGMMTPGFGMMGGLGNGFALFGVVGLVFGVIVLISALMLNSKPEQHSTWGTLILIFSILSVFGGAMGGFGVGLVLGLIGGVLAITWKPTQTK